MFESGDENHRSHGVFGGYKLIRNRFDRCKATFIELSKRKYRDQKDKNKRYDCCDASPACDVVHCIPQKDCELPDLPCDCSPF